MRANIDFPSKEAFECAIIGIQAETVLDKSLFTSLKGYEDVLNTVSTALPEAKNILKSESDTNSALSFMLYWVEWSLPIRPKIAEVLKGKLPKDVDRWRCSFLEQIARFSLMQNQYRSILQ